ncbi:SLACS-associated protein, putative [Leishmania panamensis]|uniref:SLACS-associated protein, putative n=1 Tax=Leishmania panamensis TaxID=5679 RepID=A0AC62A6I9_LEIPA
MYPDTAEQEEEDTGSAPRSAEPRTETHTPPTQPPGTEGEGEENDTAESANTEPDQTVEDVSQTSDEARHRFHHGENTAAQQTGTIHCPVCPRTWTSRARRQQQTSHLNTTHAREVVRVDALKATGVDRCLSCGEFVIASGNARRAHGQKCGEFVTRAVRNQKRARTEQSTPRQDAVAEPTPETPPPPTRHRTRPTEADAEWVQEFPATIRTLRKQEWGHWAEAVGHTLLGYTAAAAAGRYQRQLALTELVRTRLAKPRAPAREEDESHQEEPSETPREGGRDEPYTGHAGATRRANTEEHLPTRDAHTAEERRARRILHQLSLGAVGKAARTLFQAQLPRARASEALDQLRTLHPQEDPAGYPCPPQTPFSPRPKAGEGQERGAETARPSRRTGARRTDPGTARSRGRKCGAPGGDDRTDARHPRRERVGVLRVPPPRVRRPPVPERTGIAEGPANHAGVGVAENRLAPRTGRGGKAVPRHLPGVATRGAGRRRRGGHPDPGDVRERVGRHARRAGRDQRVQPRLPRMGAEGGVPPPRPPPHGWSGGPFPRRTGRPWRPRGRPPGRTTLADARRPPGHGAQPLLLRHRRGGDTAADHGGTPARQSDGVSRRPDRRRSTGGGPGVPGRGGASARGHRLRHQSGEKPPPVEERGAGTGVGRRGGGAAGARRGAHPRRRFPRQRRTGGRGVEKTRPYEAYFTALGGDELPRHARMNLLRASALPRLTFLLRTHSTDELRDSAAWFDDRVPHTLSALAGGAPIEDAAALLARLPLAMGGCGLRSQLAISRFAAQSVGRKGAQKAHTHQLDQHNLEAPKTLLPEPALEIVKANTAPGATRALADPALHLGDFPFEVLVRQRLLLRVLRPEARCACGADADNAHANVCPPVPGGPRIQRHNRVLTAIEAWAKRLGFAVVAEPRVSSTSGERLDLSIAAAGGTFATDVVITFPGRARSAQQNPLQQAHAAKKRKRGDWAAETGTTFAPVSLESTGGLHKESFQWLLAVAGSANFPFPREPP